MMMMMNMNMMTATMTMIMGGSVFVPASQFLLILLTHVRRVYALQDIVMMVKMIMIINDCDGIVMEIILTDTCQTFVVCTLHNPSMMEVELMVKIVMME